MLFSLDGDAPDQNLVRSSFRAKRIYKRARLCIDMRGHALLATFLTGSPAQPINCTRPKGRTLVVTQMMSVEVTMSILPLSRRQKVHPAPICLVKSLLVLYQHEQLAFSR